MDNFFVQHPAVAYVIIGLLITLIGYFLRELVVNNKAELKEVANKAKEIEHNYLIRFEDIKEMAEKNHREVLFLIEGVNVKLATISGQVEAQKNICQLVQDAKHRQG